MNAAILTLVASPRRREILRAIWEDELAAGAIHRRMPDVTFGAVSLQLRQLAAAGLVDCRAEGRHRYYRVRRPALGPLAGWLEGLWDDALSRLARQAELDRARRGPAPRRRRRKP